MYKKGSEDLICSKLLSLDGVEFCSVKKSGLRVVVDMRMGDSTHIPYQTGDMKATREGEILSLTAMKGTPQKKVGDRVKSGETLVSGAVETDKGVRVTEVVARASIACTYECVVETEDKQEAFAKLGNVLLIFKLDEEDVTY